MLEADVTLKDGTPVHIRPIRPEDAPVLIEAFHHLSPQSIYQRFFTTMSELSPGMARYLSDVHQKNRFALVAQAGSELAGVGRYERTTDPELVELGLLVIDAWQSRGLGRILLRHVLKAAESNGIRRFRADILADNRRMLRLLAEEMTILERRTDAGVVSITLTPKAS